MFITNLSGETPKPGLQDFCSWPEHYIAALTPDMETGAWEPLLDAKELVNAEPDSPEAQVYQLQAIIEVREHGRARHIFYSGGSHF